MGLNYLVNGFEKEPSGVLMPEALGRPQRIVGAQLEQRKVVEQPVLGPMGSRMVRDKVAAHLQKKAKGKSEELLA
jgi:hypothetical protein